MRCEYCDPSNGKMFLNCDVFIVEVWRSGCFVMDYDILVMFHQATLHWVFVSLTINWGTHLSLYHEPYVEFRQASFGENLRLCWVDGKVSSL